MLEKEAFNKLYVLSSPRFINVYVFKGRIQY
ncbi:hypothetical protein SAMN06265348_10441 [Pedobacter westerhofensis]|uniref:Uncharacterized protein n=1 Tax=Pedobacter westerhofensis TaxID=425512 RepID=A0A521CNM3_9SPHI|nr:hypothetical protein SAMN06265348_10441 [Pedobacter westerhofensis]